MIKVTDHPQGVFHTDLALGALARKIYKSRREREKRSPVPGLFKDPAWDILLDLFISYTENTQISVSSAGLAANTPTTTSLRWILSLQNAKLIDRIGDHFDKRREFVFLTPEGIRYMREIISYIDEQLKLQHT